MRIGHRPRDEEERYHCINYRLANQLIKLMNYPGPLIDELMSNFAATMLFMTLDMASGFWAVPMTVGAQLISAFICPLVHFKWKRMSFGLKNAPLTYQQLLDNCLWSFVRLPPEEERLVDPEVLEFLGISPEASGAPVSQGTDPRGGRWSPGQARTVFHQNRYIDDIIYGAPSWDDLCKTLNVLLYRLREFGVKKCKYLGHDISSDGIRTSSKLAEKVLNLSFPQTLSNILPRETQLLRQIYRGSTRTRSHSLRSIGRATPFWARSREAKHASVDAIAPAPRPQETVCNNIACQPLGPSVRFWGRTTTAPYYPCGSWGEFFRTLIPAEKEALTLLRVLNTCHTMITSCSEKKIRVYTQYSVVAWLFKSKTWAVNLSPPTPPWDLDIRQVENDEDGLASILGRVSPPPPGTPRRGRRSPGS
ncbi:LOW QUALITY PROTEIN: reverse transcriptase [Phytophthora megakarya]|uniref:Reverse transcriptase n=1 Tax=Phytophthora megakarya TaxID=4795 RepID=A0A225WYL5_9STRA|nr:LOW QUALITY PROTEIN: reverse transcriptase [Phytophthora megakarya]